MLLDLLDKIFVPNKTSELSLPPKVKIADVRQHKDAGLSQLEMCKAMMLKHGDLYRVIGNVHITANPDLAEQILKSNYDNYTKGGGIWLHLQEILGDSSFCFVAARWKERRRIVVQSYTSKHLIKYTEQVARETLPMVIKNFTLSADLDKKINVTTETLRAAHFAIVYFLLNYKSNDANFKKALNWFPYVHKIMFLSCIPTPFYFTSRITKIRLMKDLEFMMRESKKITKDYEDLITILSKPDPNTNKFLSKYEIREELMGEIMAGMITTGSVMTWTLYEIFKNKEILNKLRQEIRTNWPKDTLITYDDLNNFPYCRAVINEGLRLYPPVTFVPRVSINEDVFKNLKIAAKARIMIDVYSIHRNPNYWRDPDLFDPNRFLNNEVTHKFAFIPFSMGRQLCVGNQLAIIQLMLTTMTIVNNFDLDFPDNNMRPDVFAILSAPQNLHCGVRVNIS